MKNRRQEALLHVIQTRDVGSQEELQSILRGRGFDVNVATISRDIRELGIVKASSRDGVSGPKFRYVMQSKGPPLQGLPAMVADFVESTQTAANFLVVKTRPRSAVLVGSEIDKARWPEILGTVAGDDTIVAICTSRAATTAAAKRLDRLRGGKR
jgi:transcriptional regulator of arginine metabolism